MVAYNNSFNHLGFDFATSAAEEEGALAFVEGNKEKPLSRTIAREHKKPCPTSTREIGMVFFPYAAPSTGAFERISP